MSTTILLPVSRHEYLQPVFAGLELMNCDASKVNLLVIVDGDAALYQDARNRTGLSKFSQRLCLQFKSSDKPRKYDILGRRKRIAEIHNMAREVMTGCDFVFGVEDDTIIPANAYEKLTQNYSRTPYAGFIQGIELGRWGIPYAGAWQVDNVYEPTLIESMIPQPGVVEIDAGGFYCFMTRFETYTGHEFKPFDGNALGPDVDFGITLRQEGLINYVDWSVQCAHRSGDKSITLLNTKPKVISFHKKDGRWRQKSINDVF